MLPGALLLPRVLVLPRRCCCCIPPGKEWACCGSHVSWLPAWRAHPNTTLQGPYQLGLDWIAARNTRIHVPEEEKRREE